MHALFTANGMLLLVPVRYYEQNNHTAATYELFERVTTSQNKNTQ